ncbi:MAG: hypothetical protein ACK4X1_08920 [Terricaulis sp.]
MRIAAVFLTLAIVGCNQQAEAPAAPEEEQVFMRVPPPWFICDSINSGAVIVFDRNPNGDVRVAEYQKSDGSIVQRIGYFVGDEEGAAGSVNTELVRDQGSDGWVRQTNAGMLETPGSAYTPRFVSAQLDGRDVQCRWLPRTRVIGFSSRRSFVVHEDANGALTYTAYNFTDASTRALDGAENARTTPSSLELTGGVAGHTAEATTYTFETQGFRYVLSLNRDGTGSLDVTRDGAPLSNEPLIGYQQGTPPAPAAAAP